MTARREFLKTGGASVAVLALGFQLDRAEGPDLAAPKAVPGLRPNAFVEIRGDGRILLTVAKSEMGQGVRTSLALVLAEELGVDLGQVELVQASPGPDFKSLGTGGSTSVTTAFNSLRKAGAAAREMLVAAAAARWGTRPEACKARDGLVLGPEGKKLAFAGLVEGALKQPVPKQPRLKPAVEYTQVGRGRKRIDGPQIVSGAAQYGIDLQVPGMKVAVVTRCPVPGGKLKRLDDSKALREPGVRAVLQVPSGIAVVADGAHAALQGAKRLEVEWTEGPNAAFDSTAFWKGLETLLAQDGRPVRRDGNTEAAFASPEHRTVGADYAFPWQAHATLEPMNCLAEVKADGCEIWCGTQSPNEAQADVAQALGLKAERVTVHVALLGGGFGRRLGTDYVVEAARVAKAAGVPVKVIWRREDDLRHDLFHPGSLHRLRAAVDGRGRPAAWTHRVAAPSILRSWSGGQDSPGIPQAECLGADDLPYAIPAVKVDFVEAPCGIPLGWWRAIQIVPNVFARECFLDELAFGAKADPLAFRLELLGKGRKLKVDQGELDIDRLGRVLRLAAEKAGWGSPLPAGGGRRWGRGLACHCYEGQTCVAEVAEVSVGPKGDLKVHRVVAAVDCGLVVNPDGARAQIEGGILWGLAALRSQVTFQKGRVVQGDFLDLNLPRIQDMPRVESHLVASEAHPTGMGEPPVPPILPAILNGAFAATGKRVRRLPLRDQDLA